MRAYQSRELWRLDRRYIHFDVIVYYPERAILIKL